MRVLVCGGRDYTDRRRIAEALDTIHASRPITELIHGDCEEPSADSIAGDWAASRGIPCRPMPADWDNLDAPGAIIRWSHTRQKFFNKAAGPQRNRRMLEEGPELVVAFPGGEGTANCVRQALSPRFRIAVMSVDP